MPTYDFRCPECDTTFEITRSMGSTDAVLCPECGAESKRVFTAVGVAFKGSGFHNTDYRPRPKEESAGCPAKSDSLPKCASCPSAQTE